MRLISNSNKKNNRMEYVLKKESHSSEILIASAFFSSNRLLQYMIDNDCSVSMIVRLGIGTDPDSLLKYIDEKNISIRFFTGNYFHPKFYIFSNRIAYLGSSNFTKSGLNTNQEMNIEIDSDEPVFSELRNNFYEYWEESEVLTKEIILRFKEIISKINIVDPFREINLKIGNYEFNNVGRTGNDKSKEQIYLSNFKRNYQRYISSFNVLKELYEKSNLRRFPSVPLRIEIDRFLWWIREYKAMGETYKIDEIKPIKEIIVDLKYLIPEFIASDDKYLTNEAVNRFESLKQAFESKKKIESMDIESIYTTLLDVHAFHDRFRFFSGGHVGMKDTFLNENIEKKIRKTLNYLIFGKEDYEVRICKCIYDDEYKLDDFGESCLKELYGIINEDDIPICNGRTTKSMQWLGFGKL